MKPNKLSKRERERRAVKEAKTAKNRMIGDRKYDEAREWFCESRMDMLPHPHSSNDVHRVIEQLCFERAGL